jgi:hypothetical protein
MTFRPNSRPLHEQECNLGTCGVDHSQNTGDAREQSGLAFHTYLHSFTFGKQ